MGEAGAAADDGWRLGRRPGLDQLRGIAALMVLVQHAGGWAFVASAGGAGVTIFFVLSGFLITRLLLERWWDGQLSLREFYERRARRLFPALAVAVVLAAVVNALIGAPVLRPVAQTATYTLNYGRVTHEDAGAFNHFWSLAVEEHFYLLWPCLFLLTVSRVRRVAPVVVVVALLIAAWRFFVAGSHPDLAYMASHLRFDAMLLGAASAFVVNRVRASLAAQVAAWSVVVLFCGPLRVAHFRWADFAIALAATVLVSRMVGTVKSRPVLERVGIISYGVYLFHLPLVRVADHYLFTVESWGPETRTLRLLTISAASILAAELSWRFVEQRFVSRERAGERTLHCEDRVSSHDERCARPQFGSTHLHDLVGAGRRDLPCS